MRKTTICIGENKAAELISAFVFATWIVQSLFYLNTKFPASNNVLWLYSPVCVGPGRKPKLLVLSRTGSSDISIVHLQMGRLIDFIHSAQDNFDVNKNVDKIIVLFSVYSLIGHCIIEFTPWSRLLIKCMQIVQILSYNSILLLIPARATKQQMRGNKTNMYISSVFHLSVRIAKGYHFFLLKLYYA